MGSRFKHLISICSHDNKLITSPFYKRSRWSRCIEKFFRAVSLSMDFRSYFKNHFFHLSFFKYRFRSTYINKVIFTVLSAKI